VFNPEKHQIIYIRIRLAEEGWYKYSLKLFILIFNFLKLFKVFMSIKYSKFVVNVPVFIYKLKAILGQIQPSLME
jgi:hypothetical protein